MSIALPMTGFSCRWIMSVLLVAGSLESMHQGWFCDEPLSREAGKPWYMCVTIRNVTRPAARVEYHGSSS